MKNREEIIIGKDEILEGMLTWQVYLNGIFDRFFITRKGAINYYCKNHCNPMYSNVHYDCESCPIKEATDERSN